MVLFLLCKQWDRNMAYTGFSHTYAITLMKKTNILQFLVPEGCPYDSFAAETEVTLRVSKHRSDGTRVLVLTDGKLRDNVHKLQCIKTRPQHAVVPSVDQTKESGISIYDEISNKSSSKQFYIKAISKWITSAPNRLKDFRSLILLRSRIWVPGQWKFSQVFLTSVEGPTNSSRC